MSAEAETCLQVLAAELEQRRFAVQLQTTAGRPASLTVTNIAAPALSESVFTAPDDQGQLWFWFPWRAAIGPVDDVVAAANRVERVLAEVGRPTS